MSIHSSNGGAVSFTVLAVTNFLFAFSVSFQLMSNEVFTYFDAASSTLACF